MPEYMRLLYCCTPSCDSFGIRVEQPAHVVLLARADGEPGTVEVFRYDEVYCGTCKKVMWQAPAELPAPAPGEPPASTLD